MNEAIVEADFLTISKINEAAYYSNYTVDRCNYDALTELLITALNSGEKATKSLCWYLLKVFMNSRASITWIEKILPSMRQFDFLSHYYCIYLTEFLDTYHRYGLVKELIKDYSFENYNLPNSYIRALVANDKEVLQKIGTNLSYDSCMKVFNYAIDTRNTALVNHIIDYAAKNVEYMKKRGPYIIKKVNDQLLSSAIIYADFEVMKAVVALIVKICAVYNNCNNVIKQYHIEVSVNENAFVRLFTNGQLDDSLIEENDSIARFYSKCVRLLGPQITATTTE